MSRINLKLTLFATGFGMACMLMFPIATFGANAKVLDLMQQGYAECKNAHLLRRKDLEQAKSAYAVYMDLKDQAASLDAGIIENKDEDIARIVSYCDTVGADILRSEALPVFTLGVTACGEAAEHLRNNELTSAEKSYANYRKHKEEAVLITDAILDVFSVRTDMRRCERVAQDLEMEATRQNELAAALQEAVDYLQQTLSDCQLMMTASDLASVDEEGLPAIKTKLQSLREKLTQIPNQTLLSDGEIASESEHKKALVELRQETDACQVAIETAIDTREQHLAAVAAEELKKQQEQAAALAAQAQEIAIQEETQEQRNARLAHNYEYYTLVKRVAPEFPRRALRGGYKGYVVVEYMINTDGEVVNPVVLESQPNDVFDKAAITAIKQWQYEANFRDIEPDSALARTRMLFSYAE